jgi:hypothetical protein
MTRHQAYVRGYNILLISFFAGAVIGAVLPTVGAVLWLASWGWAAHTFLTAPPKPPPPPPPPSLAERAEYDAALEAARREVARLEARPDR